LLTLGGLTSITAGFVDGIGTNALFNGPVALDYIYGNLYIVELSGKHAQLTQDSSRY
jgi:hypothetical protein